MTQETKTLYVFRDHYKKSSDAFRSILGLFFDHNGSTVVSHEIEQLSLAIAANWEIGPQEIIQTDPLLYRQKVKFKPLNSDENKQLLQVQIGNSQQGQEIKNRMNFENFYVNGNANPTLEELLKVIVSDTSKLYRDINIKTFKVNKLNSNTTDGPWARIESNYNFSIPSYEQVIANENVPEEVLPNFYVFSLAGNRSLLESVSQKDYDESKTYGTTSPYENFMNKFDRFISLDGNVVFNQSSQNFLFAIVILGYMQQYAENYDKVSVNFIQTMSKRFGSIFNNLTNQELINRLNQFKQSYPMYIEVLFSTPLGNAFLDFLASANLTVESFTSFINEKLIQEIEMSRTLPSVTVPGGLVIFSGFEPFSVLEASSNGITENRGELLFIHDVENLIRSYVEQLINGQNDIQNNLSQNSNGGFTFLDGNEIHPSNENIQLEQLISNITAIPRFNELMRIGMRSYRDIVDGKFAKSEILYFRIEKRDKNGKVIQNFCFPNLPDVSVQSFVDTQVKYNKQYTYKVYAGTLIYGTEYYYKSNYNNVNLLPATNEVSFPEDEQSTELEPNPLI